MELLGRSSDCHLINPAAYAPRSSFDWLSPGRVAFGDRVSGMKAG